MVPPVKEKTVRVVKTMKALENQKVNEIKK